MTGKLLLLGLLLVFVTADAATMRKPNCPDGQMMACPMNFNPLCGSDGVTYPNECVLCVQMRKIKMELFIASDGSCETPEASP